MTYDTPAPETQEIEKQVDLSALYMNLGRDILSMAQDTPPADYFEAGLQPGDSSWLIGTGVENPYYNLGLVNSGSGDPAETVRHYLQILKDKAVQGIIMIPEHIRPLISEMDLDEGVVLSEYTTPHMVYTPIGEPLPLKDQRTDIQVRKVTTDPDLQAAIDMQISAFDFPESVRNTMGPKLLADPNVGMYMAVDETGKPVSTVMSIRHEDGTVGIWNMATPAESQKKGYGRHLLTTVMNDHIQSGAKVIQLTATPDGQPLYEKLGFKTVSELYELAYMPPGVLVDQPNTGEE